MSFILDALRRADRERRMGKGPDLGALYQEDPSPRRSIRPWLWAGGLAATIALAAGLSLWPSQPEPQNPFREAPTEMAQAPAVQPEAQPEVHPPKVDPPDVQTPEIQTSPPPEGVPARSRPVKPEKTGRPPMEPAPVEEASPGAVETAKAPPRRQRPVEPPAPAQEQVSAESSRPGPEPEVQPVEPPPPAPAPIVVEETLEQDPFFEEELELPPLEETRPVEMAKKEPEEDKRPVIPMEDAPEKVQKKLEGLRLNVHVYAQNPEERLVFINMQRYRAGDSIGHMGISLKEITPSGIILDHGEGLVLLKPGR